MATKSGTKIQPGHRYGHWVITSEAKRLGGDVRYLCLCDCGNEKLVSAITLRNGSSTSCGCQRKERAPKISDYELRPTPPEIQEIYALISQGNLPPADQFSLSDGAPAWTLPALARILGIGQQDLITHLRRGGSRFGIPQNPHIVEAFTAHQ
jgi:hypothetical protein